MSLIDDLKEIVNPTDVGEGETWADRLEEAAYTPPSGLRITFDYENLSYRFNKKTSAFEFPDADGTLVQDHGISGRRYPWRIYFWGAECDKQALVFEAALSERGKGELETPQYGKKTVVPFGEIARRDDLKTASNQVIFDVVFFDTIDTAYPEGAEDPASAVLSAIDAFGSAGAAEFATSLDQGSISEKQDFLDKVNDFVDTVDNSLEKVAAVQQAVQDEFDDYLSTVRNITQTFIADPLTLAFNTQRLIQSPARAIGSVSQQLDAYSNLAGSLVSSTVSSPGGPGGLGPIEGRNAGLGNDAQDSNEFHARNLFAGSAITGSILSTVFTSNKQGGAVGVAAVSRQQADAEKTGVVASDSRFNTASEAIEAADALLAQMDAYIEWKDANYAALTGQGDADQAEISSTPTNTDAGDSQKALLDAVSLAAGYLVQLSFSLNQEKSFILDRDRSVVDLSYELYGSVDNDTLDFFINSNKLAGSQILELKKGTKIVYYN